MSRGYDVRQTAIVRENINNVQSKRAKWNKNYGNCYKDALSRLDSRNIPDLKEERKEKCLHSHLPTNYISELKGVENKNEILINKTKEIRKSIEKENENPIAFEMKRPSTSKFDIELFFSKERMNYKFK